VTTANPSNLARLFRGIEALYGADSGLDPESLLVPHDPHGGLHDEHARRRRKVNERARVAA